MTAKGNGHDPRIRLLEELVVAPTVDTPDTLLSEAGQMRRELGQRLLASLPELLEEGA